MVETLAALSKDSSLIPSTHTVVPNGLKLQCQGIQHTLLASQWH